MSTNERIDHLERLLEVVRGLTTAPDLQTFLQTIISEATEMTNSELASILEYGGPFSQYFNSFEQRPEQVVRIAFCARTLGRYSAAGVNSRRAHNRSQTESSAENGMHT